MTANIAFIHTIMLKLRMIFLVCRNIQFYYCSVVHQKILMIGNCEKDMKKKRKQLCMIILQNYVMIIDGSILINT